MWVASDSRRDCNMGHSADSNGHLLLRYRAPRRLYLTGYHPRGRRLFALHLAVLLQDSVSESRQVSVGLCTVRRLSKQIGSSQRRLFHWIFGSGRPRNRRQVLLYSCFFVARPAHLDRRGSVDGRVGVRLGAVGTTRGRASQAGALADEVIPQVVLLRFNDLVANVASDLRDLGVLLQPCNC